MEVAKVIENSDGQIIQLPRNYRFEQSEVLANRIGSVVILVPNDDPWAAMTAGLSMATDDFLTEDIPDLPLQERDGL